MGRITFSPFLPLSRPLRFYLIIARILPMDHRLEALRRELLEIEPEELLSVRASLRARDRVKGKRTTHLRKKQKPKASADELLGISQQRRLEYRAAAALRRCEKVRRAAEILRAKIRYHEKRDAQNVAAVSPPDPFAPSAV